MSQQPRTQRDTARDLFREKGLVRMRDLREAGVGSETVARLVREGELTRVARGLYQLADSMPDARRSFAEASALVPRSEEHTSEIQSLMRNSYAGFDLKKNHQTRTKKQ